MSIIEINKNMDLLVFGMHRSGTSAITGLLAEIGFVPGRPGHLFKADHANEQGYYEDEVVVQCNEKLLIGDSLKNLSNFTSTACFKDINPLDGLGWILGAWGNEFSSRQCNIIESQQIIDSIEELKKESGELPLVLKDPRFSLTLPKWIPHLKIAGAVIMVRNPADVAHSLYCRDGMIPGVAYDLWLKYTLSAIKSCQEADLPYILINYDNLIEQQFDIFEKLKSFLKKIGFQNHIAKSLHNTPSSINTKLRRSNKHNSFSTPYQLHELFIKLTSENITEFISEGTNYWNKNNGWDSAVIFANLKQQLAAKEQKINELTAIIDRLNNHIIAGSIIRLLRFLKKDTSFGQKQT